jgi:hypothetical protein
MQRTTLACLAWILGLSLTACQPEPGFQESTLSTVDFRDNVYPVLIRDCGFQTCHGSEERFFRVWGPGRSRLSPNTTAYAAATSEEINTSFRRSVAMIDHQNPTESLLLRKPLATAAGGAGHLGADKFGRNLYRSVDALGYVTLSRWVFSMKE